VIGTTGDPATPYEYAVDMADRLKSGVLITYRGEGHLAFDSSECVNRLVIDYLARDRVPPDRTRC
jgi:pimeloyl-ACP methyl ester carboxylesterase